MARDVAHGNVLYLSSRTLFWSFFVLLKLLESSKGPPILCPRPPVLWTKFRPRRCPPCPIVLQNSVRVSQSPLLRHGLVSSSSVPQASISRPVWCPPVLLFLYTSNVLRCLLRRDVSRLQLNSYRERERAHISIPHG